MKRWMLRIHRWVGVVAALFLLLMATTGSIYMLRGPVIGLIGEPLAPGERMAPARFVEQVSQTHTPRWILWTEDPAAPVQVHEAGSERSSVVLFDPVTADVLPAATRAEAFFADVLRIHKGALFGDGVNTAATIALLVLLASGAVVALPRGVRSLRNSVRVKGHLGTRGFFVSSHRCFGVLAGVFILFSALTGLQMALSHSDHRLPSIESSHEPDRSSAGRSEGRGRGRAVSPEAWATLERLTSPAQVGYMRIDMPSGRNRQLAVEWAELQSNRAMARAVSIDASTGKPGEVLPPAEDLHRFAMLAHTGQLFGPFGQLLIFLGALALVYLCISGVWLFALHWMRKRPRSAAR